MTSLRNLSFIEKAVFRGDLDITVLLTMGSSLKNNVVSKLKIDLGRISKLQVRDRHICG